jgi:DNA-binding PadR family transcriptional regulator
MAFGFKKHFAHAHGHGFGHDFGYDFYYQKRGGGPNPFGKGNPFGGKPFEWGGGPEFFGKHSGGSRFFRRGDIKFALLSLLAERPMHGYEMMKALETQSGGMYTPSPGTIYPTLQMLEDRGFVTSTETEGKKVYQITEAGRAELGSQKNSDFNSGSWGDFGGWSWGKEGFQHSQDFNALKQSAKELARLTFMAFQVVRRNPAKLPELRNIMDQTAHALQEMINNPTVPADKPASGDSDTPASKESAPPQDL